MNLQIDPKPLWISKFQYSRMALRFEKLYNRNGYRGGQEKYRNTKGGGQFALNYDNFCYVIFSSANVN